MIKTTTDLRAALERGGTLPASWYSDPEVAALERERIFTRTWQYAGRADLVAQPGGYFACFVGHVPVVVVRDNEGELRGFVNVCRHRGHLVARGEGRRSTLQCPYHAWTYGLDGCLRAAPRSEREPGFDPAELSLFPVSVDSWGPLVFVNPDPDALHLADVLGQLPETIVANGLELGALRFRERREWEMPVNWKIAIENYLECYHCPVAHPGFSKLLDVDPDAYRLSAQGFVVSHAAPVRESARGGNGRAPYDPTGPVAEAQYHLLWPNTTINVEAGPANLSVDVTRPDGPTRTVGVTEYFFADDVPAETAEAMVAFATQVGAEDAALVASVQRGLDSGMVEQGQLLLGSEHLIQHFQKLVFDAVGTANEVELV